MKKNLKGMTLYEMIISIAIFAIMAGVLIGVGAHIDNTTRATNNLKKKIATESPYAANKITENFSTHTPLPKDKINVVVKVEKPDVMPDELHIKNKATGADEVYTCEYPKEVIMEAYKYKTESVYTGSESVTVDPNSPNANLNLEFVSIVPSGSTPEAPPAGPATPPTPATPATP